MTVWVNLGCGEYYAEGGWLNVDHAGSPNRADLRLDLRTDPLPWEPGTVGRAYLGHVLEHLTQDHCVDLLTRLRKLAQPGGEVMVVGPDVVRAEKMRRAGTLSDEWYRLIHEGGNRWPGDRHLWGCEPTTLQWMLTDAGWGQVREYPIWLVPDVWPVVDRNVEWQCAVGATAE